MDYIPDFNMRVIYPKGKRVNRTTLRNIKLYDLDRCLRNKVSNEFKHCLINYNPYNFIDDWVTERYPYLDDYNNYNCFKE